MIGDSLRDVQAAVTVGASPLLVLTGKGQSTVREYTDDLVNVPIYKDLSAAADALLTGGC